MPALERDPLRPRVMLALATLLGLLWCPGPALHAEDTAAGVKRDEDLAELPIEELVQVKIPSVYGASKHDQKVTEAPSSVSIVTAEDIRRLGYRTLADVLRSVRGFYVGYDRNYGYIGVRGFNRPGDFGGRILLLVDGQRLNEPLFDSAFNVTDFILDVDLIDRVEVIRGPGSSLYGNNAFFGVVNVITRRGAGVDGAEASGSFGSYRTEQGRVTVGQALAGGAEVLLSGTLYDSYGQRRLSFPEFDSPETNGGIARDIDGDQFGSALATLAYRDLTLQGAYISRDKQVPTAAYGTTFNDPRFRTTDTRAYVNLRYEHALFGDWSAKARGYWDYYRYLADYPFSGSEPGEPSVLNRDDDRAEWAGADVLASGRVLPRDRATVGVEFRNDYRLALDNFDRVTPPRVFAHSRKSARSVGVFVQDELTLLPSLILNAGIRYDHFSTFGDTVNPRLGLIYAPFEESALKLLYGTAFRAPNVSEGLSATAFQKANPALDPETIDGYEVVYEQYAGAHVRFSASGFYNRIDHLIVQRTDPADGLIFFENLDRAETKGMDLEVEGHLGRGIGRASYTLQRTTDRSTGDRLSNSPTHLGKLSVSSPLVTQWLFGGLELQASSGVKALKGGRIDGYATVNATLLATEIVKGVDVSASVYDLFDERFAYSGGEEHRQVQIPQDGRSFRIKLTARFSTPFHEAAPAAP